MLTFLVKKEVKFYHMLNGVSAGVRIRLAFCFWGCAVMQSEAGPQCLLFRNLPWCLDRAERTLDKNLGIALRNQWAFTHFLNSPWAPVR